MNHNLSADGDVGRDVSLVTIDEIARKVNNITFDEEIVVVEDWLMQNAKTILPARVDALLIILCTAGKGRIGIDLREYEVGPDTLIIIQPKNYVYLYECDEDSRASIVTCSRRMVEEVLPKFTDLLPLLIHHRTDPVSHLSRRESEELELFCHFLRRKLSGPHTPFLQRKVVCLLQAALFEMMDIQHARSENTSGRHSRKEELMARFILAVSENFRQYREVGYYAEKLCITPKHLSAVCKEISGRTAGEWIENYVTMEAKVLLKTTDLSVQEISSSLSFANQSFFGKYFKRQTGLSPTEFRCKFS